MGTSALSPISVKGEQAVVQTIPYLAAVISQNQMSMLSGTVTL